MRESIDVNRYHSREHIMLRPRAVIFDLGGTLVDWPDWDEDVQRRWSISYDYLTARLPNHRPAIRPGRLLHLRARFRRGRRLPHHRIHRPDSPRPNGDAPGPVPTAC